MMHSSIPAFQHSSIPAFQHYIAKRVHIWLVTCFFLLFATKAAISGTVIATPGSLAGYTYFPPATASEPASQGGSQDSLQRCLWAPTADQTVQVTDDFNYGKPINLLYRMVGGDGGIGINAGGGGSSAILKNGNPVVVANGADGGQKAMEIAGTLQIIKGDTLRFITGGGGGNGYWSATKSIGGGGGAGYMGGGGGSSHSTGTLTASGTYSGKGGSTIGGAGGFGPGALSGTDGSSLTGGISTFPDGSTVPTNGSTSYFANWTDWNYGTVYFTQLKTKYGAQSTTSGGYMGDMTKWPVIAGSGGGLGIGGMDSFNTSGYSGNTGTAILYTTLRNCSGGCWRNYIGALLSRYPAHTEDMKLTRQIVYDNSFNSIEYPTNGSLSGQIITMYQAPTCGILK